MHEHSKKREIIHLPQASDIKKIARASVPEAEVTRNDMLTSLTSGLMKKKYFARPSVRTIIITKKIIWLPVLPDLTKMFWNANSKSC